MASVKSCVGGCHGPSDCYLGSSLSRVAEFCADRHYSASNRCLGSRESTSSQRNHYIHRPLSGNSVVSSSKYELTATNVSGKGIVFMLVRFRVSGGRGGGTLHNIQRDNFFGNEAIAPEIAPEKTFVLDRSNGGFQTLCCVNPLESGRDPVAEVSVIYSEFTDGSTYGDKSAAADIFATRSLIIERLRQLEAAKVDETFVRLLAQKLESLEADAILQTVRLVQKSGGTEAARAQVRRDLDNATRHLAAMQAATAKSK
jgi:hypothetical protein